MLGRTISAACPLPDCWLAFLLWWEKVHLAEGLCNLQSGEGVVSRWLRKVFVNHWLIIDPGSRGVTACQVSGCIRQSWWHLCCLDCVCPCWKKLVFISSGFFLHDCRVIHVKVPYVAFRLHGVLNIHFPLVLVSELWRLRLVLQAGVTWKWGHWRWVLNWKKLIRGVPLGGMEISSGWSALGQDGWNFNFSKVWSVTTSPVKPQMGWDFRELQGLFTRPDNLRVPSLGQRLLQFGWDWYTFEDEVGRVGVAARSNFYRYSRWPVKSNKVSDFYQLNSLPKLVEVNFNYEYEMSS